MENIQKTLALILGLVLVILGIWGIFTTSILSIFGVNLPQSVLHIIAGVCGIYAGIKGIGSGYNKIIGIIGIVLGVLGLVPITATLLTTYLNINNAITWLHLVLGLIFALIGFLVNR